MRCYDMSAVHIYSQRPRECRTLFSCRYFGRILLINSVPVAFPARYIAKCFETRSHRRQRTRIARFMPCISATTTTGGRTQYNKSKINGNSCVLQPNSISRTSICRYRLVANADLLMLMNTINKL